MQRKWINQPSSLQQLHAYHGRQVLTDPGTDSDGMVRVYFTDGPVISMMVPTNALSNGWADNRIRGK